MNENLRLRKINDNDINILKDWLNKDYILKWYSDPKEWLKEIKKRNGEFKFVHHYIATVDNKSIGFCQYYDCFYAKEDWYKVEQEDAIFSIDYLIGEEDYLGKGYGKRMLQFLINEIRENTGGYKIIVQPEANNVQSNKLLKSIGFLYDSNENYYYLIID